MGRTDRIILAAALAVWLGVATNACSSRVRPGLGVSNDGQRVGLDLGQYDTTFAHPVTGAAPGEVCVGPDCGVPDPVVPVRKSEITAAQQRIVKSESANAVSWVVGLAVVGLLGIAGYVLFSHRRIK